MRSLPLLDRNMASAAARTLKQAVRPHIPLIRFPPRESTQSGFESNHAPNQMASPISLVSNAGFRPTATQSAIANRMAIDSTQLPLRYQRKEISMEEIEYIEKGGQV